ncbi:IS3 family transposase [Acetobacter sp. P1H12_c]|uniref:IS3 family transposase n=1 Tax=Acetobacter sp. P1H12_c TaxID=2762621 RepID=UPI001C04538C|nr:IS3 family transposase [Acetobacter sp. P1H12_c]
MIRFIEEYRQTYGIGSICMVLQIASSVYYAYRARQKNPRVRSQKNKELCHEIHRLWNDNFRVYGVRKVWHHLSRKSRIVARCTVEGLMRQMRQMGLKGVIRGKGSEPDGQIRNAPAHRIWCIASFVRQLSTGCGFRISLTFPHGRALYMSLSSLMYSPA